MVVVHLSGPDGEYRPGTCGGGGVQGGGGSTGASDTRRSAHPGSVGPTPSNGWGHSGGDAQPADKTGGGGGGAGVGNPNATGGTGVFNFQLHLERS